MNATLKGYIKPSPKTLPTPSTLHPETPGRVLGFKGLGFFYRMDMVDTK